MRSSLCGPDVIKLRLLGAVPGFRSISRCYLKMAVTLPTYFIDI